MKIETIEEAISFWNNKNDKMMPVFQIYKGHQRGYSFTFKDKEFLTPSNFIVDEFSVDDFDTDEKKEEFIDWINQNLECTEKLVENLTKEINEEIIKSMMKKYENEKK